MSQIRCRSTFGTIILPALLVIIASAIAFYKTVYLGYDLKSTAPLMSYYIETVIEFYGHGSPVQISMSLPEEITNQNVRDESFNSQDLNFNVIQQPDDRRGIWKTNSVTGKRRIGYTATVLISEKQFEIDSIIPTTQQIPNKVVKYLLPENTIQSDDKAIVALADSLYLDADKTFLNNVKTIYDYVTYGLSYVDYSGTTDALTAYRLGEASCGGKSRLMVALSRYIGIPARIVGGKILKQGQSTTTHIWAELYLKGHWIPFCPTNEQFANVPPNYLTLYYGERPFLTRTKDINFKYFFNIKKRLILPATSAFEKDHPLNAMNYWASFKRASISIELLSIILMLPFGILVVVIFRNLLGIQTFGTFMPSLIAVGFRETGLLYGIFLFFSLLIFGALVRYVLNRMHLLHTPRLAIILTAVIMLLLSWASTGMSYGLTELARIALFPLVIVTLTIERFCLIIDEVDLRDAVKITLLTMLVSTFAYLIMAWYDLQAIVICFPEVLLLLIAIFIYIGRYSGFRLWELIRFRSLITRVES